MCTFFISLAVCSFIYSNTARAVLPSFLKRKKQDANSSKMKAKSVQVWDRDIVCIPPCLPNQKVSYPRGKYRSLLGEKGLIGKVRLSSCMSDNEVLDEIRSVFCEQMRGRKDFPFTFLQPAGAGTKSLTVSSISSSFRWTAQQVAKLGAKQPIYILAKDNLLFQDCEVGASVLLHYDEHV